MLGAFQKFRRKLEAVVPEPHKADIELEMDALEVACTRGLSEMQRQEPVNFVDPEATGTPELMNSANSGASETPEAVFFRQISGSLAKDDFLKALLIAMHNAARVGAGDGANPAQIAQLYIDIARDFFCKRPTLPCIPSIKF